MIRAAFAAVILFASLQAQPLTNNVIPRATSTPPTLTDSGITDDGNIMSAPGRSTFAIGPTSNSVPANCCGFYAVTSASASYLWGRAAAGPTVAALNTIGQKAAGSIASPTDTEANSLFWFAGARGYVAASGGYSASSKAAIVLIAAEQWTAAANGTYQTFETTQRGSTTRNERMRVCDNGSVVLFTGTALGGYGTVCGGWKLDIQKSGTSGTARFQDTTPSTGATRVLVDLGAADAPSTETSVNNGTSAAVGFHSTGYVFTSLPVAADGTYAYCADCDPGLLGASCASVGLKSGAIAFRISGAWKCF